MVVHFLDEIWNWTSHKQDKEGEKGRLFQISRWQFNKLRDLGGLALVVTRINLCIYPPESLKHNSHLHYLDGPKYILLSKSCVLRVVCYAKKCSKMDIPSTEEGPRCLRNAWCSSRFHDVFPLIFSNKSFPCSFFSFRDYVSFMLPRVVPNPHSSDP